LNALCPWRAPAPPRTTDAAFQKFRSVGNPGAAAKAAQEVVATAFRSRTAGSCPTAASNRRSRKLLKWAARDNDRTMLFGADLHVRLDR